MGAVTIREGTVEWYWREGGREEGKWRERGEVSWDEEGRKEGGDEGTERRGGREE